MAGIVGTLMKTVVFGTLANGVQDVSYGVWTKISSADFVTQAALDTATGLAHDRFDAFHNSSAVAAWYTGIDVFLGIKTYAYFSHSTSADLQSEALFPSARAGAGTANHPKESSIVVSLRSPQPGRSGRGRFYLPATGIAMNANGVIASNAAVDDLGDAALALFNGLIDDTLLPVIASFTKGASYGVTSLVIDNKPDTQRRRTDKIVATHTDIETLTY